MLFLTVACGRRRSPSRYLIPQDYVGWVRIEFNINGAPVLEKEDGYSRFTIPESGRLQTSSSIEYGVAHDEYYYYSPRGRTVLKETRSGGNGLIWAAFTGKDEDRYPETYQYFFVGTEAQLKEFGWKSKDADGHPIVGNIKQRDFE